MTVQEIINGLEFTKAMFLFDPSTGEEKTKEQLNDMDRTTIDACEGAIELLKQYKAIEDVPYTNTGELISRDKVIEAIDDMSVEIDEGYGFQYEKWRKYFCELPGVQESNLINVYGLEEEIRCAMCENPMCTDRGCDGGCEYDEKLYADIMKVMHDRIKELPSVHLDKDLSSYSDKLWKLAYERGKAEGRKKGKWILKKELDPLPWDTDPLDWDNYDEDTHSEWKEFYFCSECGWKSGWFEGGNYCKNCGADMREGQDE